MQQPQQSTMADEEIRSLRVDCLTPTMDALYLFNCFNDNAEVLAATVLCNVQTGCHEDYGFVEFASHSVADFVLNFYNGELMPNYNNDRYCLSWDTDGFGTRWRWDRAYECCSFFGYDMEAKELDAKEVIELYSKDSIPLFAPYQNNQHRSLSDGFMYIQNSMMHPYHGGYNGYFNYQHHKYFYSQPFAYQPPYDQQLQTQWTTVGSAVHTPRKQTQVPNKRDLKLVCSKEKQRENELYLCFNELNWVHKSCYVFRTIKLSELFACSCKLPNESDPRSRCNYCASKTKPESQLRQRAWLYTGEKVPASCGGEEARIPESMGCCVSGSQFYFAGGEDKIGGKFVSSGDVYSFVPESTSLQKHDWSFRKGKPVPMLLEVNGNFYCLAGKPRTGDLKHPTFEVYNTSTRDCEPLPDPPFHLLELNSGYSQNCVCSKSLAYAIVGTKILVSSTAVQEPFTNLPISCFDVKDKEKKWREMTTLFDGKPFPLAGRALVLDLNGATSDKVMFSFRKKRLIYLSLLVENANGDISISHDDCLEYFPANILMRDCKEILSHDFVDLGNQKVGFVICGSIYDWEGEDIDPYRKVRVVVVVIHYDAHPKHSRLLRSEIQSTRCFEYKCHSPAIYTSDLVGSFVV